jgi:hypothetical protein
MPRVNGSERRRTHRANGQTDPVETIGFPVEAGAPPMSTWCIQGVDSAGRDTMFSKNILVLAGLTLIGSPAAAAGKTPSKTQSQEKTYCLQFEPSTGSHISRTECKTKKNWALVGIDLDELLAR